MQLERLKGLRNDRRARRIQKWISYRNIIEIICVEGTSAEEERSRDIRRSRHKREVAVERAHGKRLKGLCGDRRHRPWVSPLHRRWIFRCLSKRIRVLPPGSERNKK